MSAEQVGGIGLLVVVVVALVVAYLETRRRHRDHRFQSEMLDALDDQVCRFRVDDLTITFCNDAWARSVGTTPSDAIGRPLGAFVSAEALAGTRSLLAERGGHDGESRRLARLRTAGGDTTYQQWWDRVIVHQGRRELLCVGRDVTETARVERRLARSERQHRDLIERLPLAAFVRSGHDVVFANPAAAELFGLESPEQLRHVRLDAFFTAECLYELDDRIARRDAGDDVEPILRGSCRTMRGEERTVDIHTAPFELDGVRCTLAVVADVTDVVEATSAVTRSEERFRALAERSTDVIFRIVAGREPQIEYVNQAFTTLTGLSIAEFTERPSETVNALLGEREAARFLGVLVSAQGPRSFQLPITHLDGTRRWVDVRRTLSMNLDGALVVDGTMRDVTAEKSLEETLRDLANVDELTGLANRRALEDELERRLATGDELSVLFLDLDRFKDVNDTLGHLVGDDMLREIGQRLRRSCRVGDFVARLAGDEFIVITGTEPEVVADRVRSELAMPLMVGDSVLSAQASIGITRANVEDTAVSLLGRADVAMYEAKRARGRRHVT